MITELIEILDAAGIPVATRNGLAQTINGQPAVHSGSGQFVPVTADNSGTWSYWRINGQASASKADIGEACMGVNLSLPLRYVAWVDRDECSDAIVGSVNAMRLAGKSIKDAIGAATVSIERASWGIDTAWAQEYSPAPPIAPSRMLVNIDLSVRIIGSEDCMSGCADAIDVLCVLIGRASNAKVVECLGDRINEICESSGTVNIRNSNDSATLATVDCGTDYPLPPIRVPYVQADGTDAYFLGYTDGIVSGELTMTEPGGGPPPVPRFTVFESDGSTVNAYRDINGPTYTLPEPDPCDDGSFKTTDGLTEIAAVPSGSSVNAPQSVIKYADEDGVEQNTDPYDTEWSGFYMRPSIVVESRAIRNSAFDLAANRKATLYDLIFDTLPQANDAVVQLKDSVGNDIGTADNYPSNTTSSKTAPDGSIQLKDSAGNNIGSPVNVRSNQTGLTVTAPDGTVVVKNLNGTTLGSPTVKSNGSTNYTAPIPLKFGWGAGNSDTLTWTVTDDEAGTYSTYTNDGGSGTLTYSKNGGAFAALSGSITLAVGNTVVVRRTITTNAGWSKWAV